MKSCGCSSGSRGGHEFRSVGTLELKGLPDPVGAAEVMWTPAAVALAVPLPGALAPDEGEWAFAGRDAAFAQLQSEWKAAVAGEPRIVMIVGEPGIGKTRLVAELARAVHDDGALVLLGRTDEHVDAPYGPWREALRALVRSVPDEVLESHVADHGGELTRIVPDLARRIEGATASVAPDPETERLLLFEAVNGLLDVMSAEAPVLLVLDDLHWADRSSLQLLLHVFARRHSGGAARSRDLSRHRRRPRPSARGHAGRSAPRARCEPDSARGSRS